MIELTEVIREEEQAMRHLLSLLDKQFKLIMDKDVFALEDLVDEIKDANKVLAEKEVERRKLTGHNTMTSILNNTRDENLDRAFRDMKKVIEEVKLQKDTNELLLKQEISFNNRILNYINPRREINTYNSYGNLRK
ncbi:MAG: flagellar protein FlgN [Clostridium sp.]